MIKETESVMEASVCEFLGTTKVSIEQPIQELFDECLNFISVTDFVFD